MVDAVVVPVVMDVHLPAGMAGPEPLDFDDRCFLLRHDDGVTLIDTGLQADACRSRRRWPDWVRVGGT